MQKFRKLPAEVIRSENDISILVSNIPIAKRRIEIANLKLSNKGTPIIGNFDLDVPVYLEDMVDNEVTIGVRGIVYYLRV